MQASWDKKTAAREILGKDYMRKIVSKSTNGSHQAWKNKHYDAKDTPFGNFPGPRKKKVV